MNPSKPFLPSFFLSGRSTNTSDHIEAAPNPPSHPGYRDFPSLFLLLQFFSHEVRRQVACSFVTLMLIWLQDLPLWHLSVSWLMGKDLLPQHTEDWVMKYNTLGNRGCGWVLSCPIQGRLMPQRGHINSEAIWNYMQSSLCVCSFNCNILAVMYLLITFGIIQEKSRIVWELKQVGIIWQIGIIF